ncbi:T9SS C-terminal target domain-containing protein [Flavobacteriaceae bacterium PRS1]|jgi:hypothetical protein|nr:T9SS C-terminal target domain-containing protein [Flavobacteriaceae bacterium PRS1]
MKKSLLFLSLSLFFQQTYSQCIESVTNFGNNTVPAYQITGDVTVTLNANDTFTLDLGANFNTASGPDVRAYIVKSNGLSDVMLQTAKISDLENNSIDKITIYPNPASDIVHLKGMTDIETEIHIFDIFGKLVYSQNKNNKDIDVSQFNAGIYLLSISSHGQKTTKKLVIQ